MDNKIHQGRNVKRFREMLGIKQEALAMELGSDWNQKKISLLEQKESIEPELMQQVATVLKVPVQAIENFDEQAAVSIISNTFNDSSIGVNYYPVFNPIDRWMEALDKNEKLYERLLQSEREKVELMQKIINKD